MSGDGPKSTVKSPTESTGAGGKVEKTLLERTKEAAKNISDSLKEFEVGVAKMLSDSDKEKFKDFFKKKDEFLKQKEELDKLKSIKDLTPEMREVLIEGLAFLIMYFEILDNSELLKKISGDPKIFFTKKFEDLKTNLKKGSLEEGYLPILKTLTSDFVVLIEKMEKGLKEPEGKSEEEAETEQSKTEKEKQETMLRNNEAGQIYLEVRKFLEQNPEYKGGFLSLALVGLALASKYSSYFT